MSTFDNRYYQIRIAKEVGIIAAILAVGIGVVSLIQNKVQESVLESAGLRQAAAQSNTERLKFDHYRTELRATEDVRVGALAALLPTEDIRPLTESLGALASKDGLKLTLTAGAPAPVQPTGGPIKLFSIDLSIQIIGSHSGTRAFIADAEKLPYFFAITRFSEQTDMTNGQTSVQLGAKLWTKPTQSLTESQ